MGRPDRSVRMPFTSQRAARRDGRSGVRNAATDSDSSGPASAAETSKTWSPRTSPMRSSAKRHSRMISLHECSATPATRYRQVRAERPYQPRVGLARRRAAMTWDAAPHNVPALPAARIGSSERIARMTKKIPLTLACGDYEIVRALKEGTVSPDGIDLTILTDMDSDDAPLALPAQPGLRHGRDLGVVLHRGARSRACRSRRCRCSSIAAFATASSSSTPPRASSKPTDLIGRRSASSRSSSPPCIGCAASSSTNTACRTSRSNGSPSSTKTSTFTPPADLKLRAAATTTSPSRPCWPTASSMRVIHSDIIKPFVASDPHVGSAVPRLQGRGDRVLQEDRHLPDHACAGHQAGDRRAPSLGAGQHVPCLQ